MNDFNSESLSLNGKPAFYTAVYSDLREIAYKYGWALGLHGSLANDMDIMAMPWTKDASSIDILIRELQAKFDGPFKGVDVKPYRGKPNGRVVYSIPIFGDLYLDINVIEKGETMSCKAAKFDPDEGRYYCDVSGDQCMYYIPNSKKCAKEYGEGPDAYDKLGDIISDYTSNSDVVFSEYLRSRLNSGELDLTDDEIKELLRLTGDDEYASVEDIREKHRCGECVHCDFEDYYDEETCDNVLGYYCALDRKEFDYDNGHCDQYR